MRELLEGAWDLHFHTSPDVVNRKYADLELAKEWDENNMAGGVIKSHFLDTVGRAYILNELFPNIKVYGGMVLNKQVALNPYAVEKMAKSGGKFLWFPTMDSYEYQKLKNTNINKNNFIALIDEHGKIKKEIFEIAEIIKKYDLIVGTGHIGSIERERLIDALLQKKVEKIVLTHAENPHTHTTKEKQLDFVKKGVKVEYSYFSVKKQRVTFKDIVNQIKNIGVSNCFLVTDFGQLDSPGSADGLLEFAEGLLENGITLSELEIILKNNQKTLLGI